MLKDLETRLILLGKLFENYSLFRCTDSASTKDLEKMTDSAPKKQKKIKFEDNEYDFDTLPDEAKNDINGLQVCEAQLKLYSDTLKLLNMSRKSMAESLKNNLKDVSPL